MIYDHMIYDHRSHWDLNWDLIDIVDLIEIMDLNEIMDLMHLLYIVIDGAVIWSFQYIRKVYHSPDKGPFWKQSVYFHSGPMSGPW